MPAKRILKAELWLVLLLLIVPTMIFIIWASNPLRAMPEAKAALRSSQSILVTTDRWIVFEPTDIQPNSGVIFYPGGRVEPEAYAPGLRQLAQAGYLTVIVPMPLNLAVFAPGSAREVINAYPSIKRWIIGGHSLGGAMAASFVMDHPDRINGLYLWAAYPAGSVDLSKLRIKVLSIIGTLDGVANMQRFHSSINLLPPESVFTVIEGGNHAQFGWYGDQPGDFKAEISRENQQELTIQAMLDLLEEIQ